MAGWKKPKVRKAVANLGAKYATTASPAQPGAAGAQAKLFYDKYAKHIPKPGRKRS